MAASDALTLQSANKFRRFLAVALLTISASAAGCGRPFNVKTQPDLPPPSYAADAATSGITIAAQAITDEDFLYDTFDANLISAGILPVRVKLTNENSQPIELKRARFDVQAGDKRFRAINAEKAFKRLFSYYEISAYTKSGYKESLEAFEAFALDLTTQLEGKQSRQGLVFVPVPSDVARGPGLTMLVDKLNGKQGGKSKPVELKLN